MATDEELVHEALVRVAPMADPRMAIVAVQALRRAGRLKGSVELTTDRVCVVCAEPIHHGQPHTDNGVGTRPMHLGCGERIQQQAARNAATAFMTLPPLQQIAILEHMEIPVDPELRSNPHSPAARGHLLICLKTIRERGEIDRLRKLVTGETWPPSGKVG